MAKPNPFAKKAAGAKPAPGAKSGKPMPPWLNKGAKGAKGDKAPAMKAGGKVKAKC